MRCNLSQRMHPPRISDFCGLLLYPASLIAIKKDNSTGRTLTNLCLARKKLTIFQRYQIISLYTGFVCAFTPMLLPIVLTIQWIYSIPI